MKVLLILKNYCCKWRFKTSRIYLKRIQYAYRSQGVEIGDKHVEVIARQMLRKVRILDPGDTEILPGELMDIHDFKDHVTETLMSGGQPATARPVLLGITKAALETNSFLSAASFQETTRVLTDAVIRGKSDDLVGLKEMLSLVNKFQQVQESSYIQIWLKSRNRQ